MRNGRSFDAVPTLPASEPLTGPFDRVLVKVPKTLALLEEQLIRLQGQLAPGAQVIAGAMIKHLPRAAGDLLERYIGPVQASLAVKKSPAVDCHATTWLFTRQCADRIALPHALLAGRAEDRAAQPRQCVLPRRPGHRHPRVPATSAEKNLGTARVADLGCGNGVLAIASALQNPEAHYTLVDESYMAVQSAAENWRAALGEREVTLRAGDGLAGQEAQSLDVVLCNPPFHQQQVVGDFLAWRMFQQAREALVVGGALYIVGNRHLGYHSKLARLFRGVEQVAATPKFVILKARK
nr:methyltransferase [Pseudomonas brassicacearum subsp. brassicacearum]